MTRQICAISTLALLLGTSAAVTAKPKWRPVTTADGIMVHERQKPGHSFPTFRGVGTINANLYQVVAVISDATRHKQWMYRCMTSRVLKVVSPTERIIYGRTDSPWPVADRDAVYYSRAVVRPKKFEVILKFRAINSPLKRKVPGVVRMNKLSGYYRLKALSWHKTKVWYHVDADPGGSIPKWLAKIATKRLPLYTIRNLRKQVKKTKGWYRRRIAQWQAKKW